MDNFIRLPANESDFSISQLRGANLVSFNLPANSGSYDLSQSYVAVQFSTKTTITAAVDNPAGNEVEPQFDIMIKFDENAPAASRQNTIREGTTNGQQFDDNCVPSVILVKNAKMDCDKGQVEVIRNVACLRSSLMNYTKDRFQKLQDINQLNQAPYPQPFNFQSTKNFSSLGSDNTEDVLFETRIPLKDIFNIGQVRAWNTNNYGQTQISLELNLNKLKVENPYHDDNVLAKLDYQGSNSAYSSFLDTDNAANGNGNQVLGTDTFPLISHIHYQDIRDIPYYVGERLSMRATINGNTTNKIVQIASLDLVAGETLQNITIPANTQQQNRLKVTLTNGADFNITDGHNAEQISLVPIPTTTQGLLCNNIELVAKMSSEKPSGTIQYTTYMVQEDVVPASTSISRTYSLPANTTNAFVLFPNPIFSNEDLHDYRLSIDDEMVYNRNIVYKGVLHYDLISNLFANQGKVLKDLREEIEANVPVAGTAVANQKLNFADVTVVGVPIPLKNEPTILGVELNHRAGGNNFSGKIAVYSEVIKSI